MTFDFSKIVEPVKLILEKYKDLPNIELEGRLGVYDHDENVFDTNIGDEYYSDIKNLLDSCVEWKEKQTSSTTDYFSDCLRLTTDNNSAQQYCIRKKKLAMFTFLNETGPLDFRISIATEEPVRVDSFSKKKKNSLKQREKDRKSYILNDFSYDLTKVVTKEDNTPIEYCEYEVEFQGEFEDKDSGQIIFSLIMKLLDASAALDGFVKTKDNSLPLDKINYTIFKAKEVNELTGKLNDLKI
jgi:hypothetical protein